MLLMLYSSSVITKEKLYGLDLTKAVHAWLGQGVPLQSNYGIAILANAEGQKMDRLYQVDSVLTNFDLVVAYH